MVSEMNQVVVINKLLHDYFDMLYFCDLDKFEKVFHPKAIYATADEEAFLYRNMSEYKKVLAERLSPASKQEIRKDFIDSVELAGENTARAKVRCSIGSKDFVDYLTLVRVNGEWSIISKVFQIKQSV